jgi:hypothetical protein
MYPSAFFVPPSVITRTAPGHVPPCDIGPVGAAKQTVVQSLMAVARGADKKVGLIHRVKRILPTISTPSRSIRTKRIFASVAIDI